MSRELSWLKRAWHSPVLMTWGASGVRSLNLLLVLPLVVTRLDPAEIAVWYLFTTLIQLQLLADLGFSPTFVRVFAFAAGGADVHELRDRRGTEGSRGVGHNWGTIERIWGTVRTVYTRLTLVAVAGLLLLGTPFVYGPIQATPEPGFAWGSWGIILVGSTVILRGNAYAAYLTGLDHVALVRRWEAGMVLCASLSQAIVLFAGGGLLALTLAHQFWMVLNVARNWYLARVVEGGRLKAFSADREPEVMAAVWPSAWRSGIGLAMGNLPLQLTGLFYAQVAPAVRSAEYLVSLNVLTSIRGFSMAPFYSRLPAMARFRATGSLDTLLRIAKRGMALSYWTFTVMVVTVGFLGEHLLASVGANVTLVSPSVWALFGLAYLVERYGAMHLQLYSTTNHILWHVVNGATGLVTVLIAAAGYFWVGVVAFPLAVLVAFLAIYVPYIVPRSLSSLATTSRHLDAAPFLPPAFVMLAYLGYALTIS